MQTTVDTMLALAAEAWATATCSHNPRRDTLTSMQVPSAGLRVLSQKIFLPHCMAANSAHREHALFLWKGPTSMRLHLTHLILGLLTLQAAFEEALAQGGSPPLAASALHAAPSSKTPAAFADELADVARRCWLRREPAFSGFASAAASTTTSTRGDATGIVTFAERRPSPEATRALRILVVAMNRGELTVIAQQRGAGDAVPVLERDIGSMLKQGRAPC